MAGRLTFGAIAVAMLGAAALQPAAAASTTSVGAAPAHSGVYRFLEGVSAVSNDDVWAVGTRTPRGFLSQDAFVQQWDGSRWHRVPTGVHKARMDLHGVDALATDDVWAVGTRTSHAADDLTLTMHWDGGTWSRVPSPNRSVSNGYDELDAVSGTASDDVWAVGSYLLAPARRPLIEHWDGASWTAMDSPLHGSTDRLDGIAALAADDVWAVGSSIRSSGPQRTFVVHWDGARWRHVPSPNIGSHFTFLNAVTAMTADDVWAVGGYYRGDGQSRRLPLAEHWDGEQWTLVPVPHPQVDVKDTSLTAVSGSATGKVWAVGSPSTLAHWDGTAWTLAAPPDVDGISLGGVTTLERGDAWAVGEVAEPNGTYEGWHLHWDGSSWRSR